MEQISREGWGTLGISAAIIIVAVVIWFGIGYAQEDHDVWADQMCSDLDKYGGTVYLVDGHTCSVTEVDVVDKQGGLLKITHTKSSSSPSYIPAVTYIHLKDISAIYIRSH